MTTYYFIRHAEKELNGQRNPRLTEKGRKRAEHWAEVLADKNIEEIYCTYLTRTQETAQPLLNKLNLDYHIYDMASLYSSKFQRDTKNKTVLVVGHQDTTPAFINRILKEREYGYIPGREFGNLYKVEIKDNGEITTAMKKVEF